MEYLDTGSRDPLQALGTWFENLFRDQDVAAFRWQTGFFTADGLGFLAPTLERIRSEGGQVVALIGSNNGDTLRVDLERLVPLIGVPRERAHLGIVSYGGSFFHPKVYHATRRDGTEAAYVGSANLTSAGVGSLHVEAGLVLDTRHGDPADVVSSIATAIDWWFAAPPPPGLRIVASLADIAELAAEGILAEAPFPRALNERGAGNASAAPSRPRLRPLRELPDWDALRPTPPNTVREVTRTYASGTPTTGVEDPHAEDTQPEFTDTAPPAIDRDSDSHETPVSWETVWISKGLTERDLNIPSGNNTNPTGSIGLKKGNWSADIDHRHYFRDEVFEVLQWTPDARRHTRETAAALFEVCINGSTVAETALVISHNTDITTTTYKQRNEMTHLRWGEVKEWVARPELLGAILTLQRERRPDGRQPRFRISIDSPPP